MNNKAGIIRIGIIYFICFVLIFYNLISLPSKTAPIDNVSSIESSSQQQPQDSPNEEVENKTQDNKEETSTESVTAATTGNIKGKVISRYISPYTAALSYNKVYMKNSTGVAVDIKSLVESAPVFKIEKNDNPQVLIMHTHTTETFMDTDTDVYTDAYTSRTRDKNKNMVSVGKIVAERLKAAGIGVVHDTTEHDYPKYTGSYTRSANTIKNNLKKYPSIKIVLDLHRDAVSSGTDKVKLVTDIKGQKAAQIMIVMGSGTGSVTNHPNWQQNLKLGLKLQQTIENKYPTLARPLSLVSSNYNQNLTTGSLLIEFGTDANALAEVHYSAKLVGDALVSLLTKEYV